jgi:tRNA pseudouridine55 synthase
MDGIILVNKPRNCTSHDIVLKIRTIIQMSKVGHFGTLDPMATGLLIISAGKATRLFPFYSKTDKVYTGVIKLGFSTSTYDAEGEKTSKETHVFPGEKNVLKAMKSFEGEILQTPPAYSAKKYHGKPFYALARAQKEFTIKPIKKNIYHFKLTRFSLPDIHFDTKCSSGTYIRSLAHDLGQMLGCGAHLSELSRTASGAFTIADSMSLESINTFVENKKFEAFFLPLETLLPEFPKIILNETGSTLTRNGNVFSPENIIKIIHNKRSEINNQNIDIFRVFSHQDRIIGLAKKMFTNDGYHPFLVFNTQDQTKKG